jgi:hypothetical protein
VPAMNTKKLKLKIYYHLQLLKNEIGINLTTHVQDFLTARYRTLVKKIKDLTNGEAYHVHGLEYQSVD